jgi:hypothetical protein
MKSDEDLPFEHCAAASSPATIVPRAAQTRVGGLLNRKAAGSSAEAGGSYAHVPEKPEAPLPPGRAPVILRPGTAGQTESPPVSSGCATVASAAPALGRLGAGRGARPDLAPLEGHGPPAPHQAQPRGSVRGPDPLPSLAESDTDAPHAERRWLPIGRGEHGLVCAAARSDAETLPVPHRSIRRVPGIPRTVTLRPLGSSTSSSLTAMRPAARVPVTTVPKPRIEHARSSGRRGGPIDGRTGAAAPNCRSVRRTPEGRRRSGRRPQAGELARLRLDVLHRRGGSGLRSSYHLPPPQNRLNGARGSVMGS